MRYSIKVLWEKNYDEAFTNNKYSRVHKWLFDGGVELPASSSPHVVPVPMSDESAVDPEEAFVASLASCHMLFFLSIAAKQNYIVDKYEDKAVGIMEKNKDNKKVMSTINLNPNVTFSGSNIPTSEQVAKIHQLAHTNCFIANSVKSKINITSN